MEYLTRILETMLLAAVAEHHHAGGSDESLVALTNCEERYGAGALVVTMRVERAARDATARLVTWTPRRYQDARPPRWDLLFAAGRLGTAVAP